MKVTYTKRGINVCEFGVELEVFIKFIHVHYVFL